MADALLKRTDCLMGVFDDEEIFVEAVRSLKNKNFTIKDAFTPFPVHGLGKAIGLPGTRLGYVTFFAGLFGASFAFTAMSWMMGFNWPMNIGGKPEWPYPSFVPITFEFMVLIGALGTVLAFLLRNTMMPGFEPKIYHTRASSDRFVVLVAEDENSEQIQDLMGKYGAEAIYREEYVEQKSPFPLPIKMK